MPEPSIIDERLAEIDRRLRTIQSGLRAAEPTVAPAEDPGRDELAAVARALEEPPLPVAAPPLSPPTPLRAASLPADAAVALPADADAALPQARAETGGGPAVDLVAQLRELGEAHERLLELHRELLSQYAEVLEHRVAADTASIPVTAGPFGDGPAVHAFERALELLPGVASVTVREYLDGDRVTLDVRLAAGGAPRPPA